MAKSAAISWMAMRFDSFADTLGFSFMQKPALSALIGDTRPATEFGAPECSDGCSAHPRPPAPAPVRLIFLRKL
jgi:hypothetical protein